MSDRIEKIKAMLEKQPLDTFLNHALALEYIKIGEEMAAKERFELNLQTDANYVGTYYHLGKLLERINEKEAALSLYEKGIKIAMQLGEQHAASELRGAYEDLADW